MTTSSYTQDEDFSKADAVVPELGEAINLSSLTQQGLQELKAASKR